MHALTLLLLTVSPVELIDGAEIGTAEHSVFFESKGIWKGEKVDKKAGNTQLSGTWTMLDEKVDVKVAACKGPACKELKQNFTATVQVMADRAILVRSPSSLFPSGSYYCHYLGCEPRVGVELLSKNAKASALTYLRDLLIDKNTGRNSTVVWWGKKAQADVGATHIEYCPREEAKAKAGAEELLKDLAEATWVGKPEIKASDEKDCLWDVRLYVADDVTPPARKKP